MTPSWSIAVWKPVDRTWGKKVDPDVIRRGITCTFNYKLTLVSTISWNALKRWWTHFSLLRNNQCCNCKEFFTLNILLQKYFKSIFGSRVLDYSLTFLISSFSDRPGGGGSSRSHYINSNQGIPPMLIVTIHFLKQKKMDLGQMVRYLRWTLEKIYTE